MARTVPQTGKTDGSGRAAAVSWKCSRFAHRWWWRDEYDYSDVRLPLLLIPYLFELFRYQGESFVYCICWAGNCDYSLRTRSIRNINLCARLSCSQLYRKEGEKRTKKIVKWKCFNYSDVNHVYFMFISMLAKGYARCIRNYPPVLLAVLAVRNYLQLNGTLSTQHGQCGDTLERDANTATFKWPGRMAAFMLCISIVTCFRWLPGNYEFYMTEMVRVAMSWYRSPAYYF